MRDTPLISVVIPCHNAERWIAATLRSVLAQDWPPLEVIVVDDGSSDASVAVVDQGFPQVRLLRQLNRGVAAARNFGIREAQGGWIAFVDADDIWLPGKLKAQWEALAACPEARVAYTAWQVWPSEDAEPAAALLQHLEVAAQDPTRWLGATGWIYPDLLLECAVWTSTVLAERTLFDEVGLFDESLRVGEDYDLWLRVSQTSQIIRVARPYALYRAHPSSITRTPLPANYQVQVIERAIKRWGYAAPDGRSADKKAVDRGLAFSWRNFAGAQFMAGDMVRARYGIVQALKKNSLDLDTWVLCAKIGWRNIQSMMTRGGWER
ncbi:MAG: glycosyltransferase family 2 protein [Rhodocyclaceae bacterium]